MITPTAENLDIALECLLLDLMAYAPQTNPVDWAYDGDDSLLDEDFFTIMGKRTIDPLLALFLENIG